MMAQQRGGLFKRRRDTARIDGPLTGDRIRQWLVDDLARRLEVSPEEIDTTKTFEAYGLDSRVAVQVSGALEKLVERRLSPALLYDYQTIDDLSGYLARELHVAEPA